jgi:hypothetical protein
MTSVPSTGVPKPPSGLGLPPPDSPGGVVLVGGIILGTLYVLLFVGAYSALCAQALWIVTLNLILGVVVSMFLVSMLGSDRARATAFELEFARTVQAHLAAGESLVEASPLGGILRGYANAAHEQRRAAREHVYAAGPALYSTALALLATLLVGLAYVAGGDPNVIGVGMFFELGALFLIAVAAGALALSVGRNAVVPGFDVVVLRRWSHVTRPSFPFTHSLTEVPWAVDASEAPPPFPWQEATDESASPP